MRTDASQKKRLFVSIISITGILLMILLGAMSVPVEYQLIAVLFANQTLRPIIELSVLIIISTGLIALVLPNNQTNP